MRKHSLALALTNRCPLRCDFCCVPPGPGDLHPDMAARVVQEAIECEAFKSVGFTGGEPMLRPTLVGKLGSLMKGTAVRWGMTTGMGWARKKDTVETYGRMLLDAAIDHLTVSFDPSHLRQLNDAQRQLIQRFVLLMAEGGVRVTVSATLFGNDAPPLDLPKGENIKVEYHYVAPVGFAAGRQIPNANTLSLDSTQCPLNEGLTLSVWPDGSVYPCCSTYVVNKDRALVIGNIKTASLGDILLKALGDNYLCAIREIGFAGAFLLTSDLEVWRSAFNQPLQDPCHLCSVIARTPNAISDIRSKLTQIVAQDEFELSLTERSFRRE